MGKEERSCERRRGAVGEEERSCERRGEEETYIVLRRDARYYRMASLATMARLVRRRAVGGAPCTFSTCPSLPAATIPGPSPLPFTPPLETSGRPSPLACAQPTLVTRAWVEEELEVSREHLTPELPLHLLTPACRLYWGRGEEAPLADPWWAIYWPGGQVGSCWCWCWCW